MKAILAAGAALALLAIGAGSADAQNRGGGFDGQNRGGGRTQITLFALPDYQGPSRTWTGDVENLADQGFNDMAQSARVEGRWQVCEDSRLRGRCVELSGDVPNLAAMRMTAAISSFANTGGGYGGGRPGGGGFNNGGGFGGGGGFNNGNGGFNGGGGNFGGQRVDGRSVSFFPNPAPGPYRNADDFCRRMGFSGVVYADDRGQQLRDVVCRR